jgi:hypothetical protein
MTQSRAQIFYTKICARDDESGRGGCLSAGVGLLVLTEGLVGGLDESLRAGVQVLAVAIHGPLSRGATAELTSEAESSHEAVLADETGGLSVDELLPAVLVLVLVSVLHENVVDSVGLVSGEEVVVAHGELLSVGNSWIAITLQLRLVKCNPGGQKLVRFFLWG